MNSKRFPWSRIQPKTTSALLLGIALLIARPGVAAGAAPWLFVSDIHLKSYGQHAPPSRLGDDTDHELLDSAIGAMQRADPHPPVVVVTGDLLSHDITTAAATATTVLVAQRLNHAFPQAQFILALGNEDGACGDYGLTPDSASLRAIAAAWAPLVNRRGAAPDFVRTFAHDGFYTARLPLPNLRAIVVDDVFWSPRYRSGCGPASNAALHAMNEFEAALRDAPGRLWVLFHIPPGVDAFSTAHLTHRLAIVPFLRPDMRDRFVGLLTRSSAKIALAVAGHTHKFAYRIVDPAGPHPVPMLLVPGLSPVFRNASSFLTATVASDGSLGDVEETSFLRRRWQNVGGSRSLGAATFTGRELVALQARLAGDPTLRAQFARLYNGGAPSEIDPALWSVYFCAATSFTTAAFRTCDGAGGIGVITQRGVKVFTVVALALAVLVAAAGFAWWRLRRRPVGT